MLFQTITFFMFFSIFYCFYLLLQNKTSVQTWLLLIASYYFYSTWSTWLAILLIAITIYSYVLAIIIRKSPSTLVRNLSLFCGIAGSGMLLCAGKIPGLIPQPSSLILLVFVGISFYTLKIISYLLECYWQRLDKGYSLLTYATYLAYFPQLLAGPIDRPQTLCKQLEQPRTITKDKVTRGLFIIFWGLFMKIFIADPLSLLSKELQVLQHQDISIYIMNMFAYGFRLYSDFAGYSYISIGLGLLLGISSPLNFNLPLFSKNIVEFWQRWHISLSLWIRDYIFIPLWSLHKNNRYWQYFCLITAMMICGLWHGIGSIFLLWGFYNGLLLIIAHIKKPHRTKVWQNILITFIFFSFGANLLQSNTLTNHIAILQHIQWPILWGQSIYFCLVLFWYLLPLYGMEQLQYKKNNLWAFLELSVYTKIIILCAFVFFGAYYLIFSGQAITGAPRAYIYFEY